MNKVRQIAGLLILLPLIWSCSSAQSPTEPKSEAGSARRILIVYLSRTNNTRALAQIIQDKVGGKLIALEVETPYPTDYRIAVKQVSQENTRGFLPPLKTKIDSMNTYDVVFVGFPTWGMQLPPPIKSFLSQYDLSNKTIVPFNTNAGYGIGRSFDQVKLLSPASQVLEGYSTTGGIERDGVLFVMEGSKRIQIRNEVDAWLTKVGLLK